MYNRPEQLLEKYPLSVKSFSKGRECYLFDTGLGTFALREYRGSKERAAFFGRNVGTFEREWAAGGTNRIVDRRRSFGD